MYLAITKTSVADMLYASTAVCLSIAQYQRYAKCVNSSGGHPVNSKQCTAWTKEKKILKIKCEQDILFPEARKQYEQFYTRIYASAVKPSTCNKSTQTEEKYIKQITSEKTPKETLKGKPEKNTSSPRPGPALMLEMIKKERERKKKREMELSNNRKKTISKIK